MTGNDELARLTVSFNTMLRALGESRNRQSRLVADAGHELRTPLTSLRTNMELLIASSRPGAPSIPDEDMADLRADVVAQIEELSTLVGDLVDLAREDAPETVFELVDLSEVVERSLEKGAPSPQRDRLRGTDDAVVHLRRPGGLSRAVLNVLDNAAKWSPPGTVSMSRCGRSGPAARTRRRRCGPGIPLEDRELVFERFYRSTASRSMPGRASAWPSSGRSSSNTAARSRWRRRTEAAPGSAIVLPGEPEAEGADPFGRFVRPLCCPNCVLASAGKDTGN